MSHSARSAGGRGPWQADDDLATLDGSYTGPAVGEASPRGTLTVDGRALRGDVINVYENANKIATGPVLSGVLRNTHRP